MNIYDTKVAVCADCKKPIGEIDFDAVIIHPLCGNCVNFIPKEVKKSYIDCLPKNKPLIGISLVS